VDTVVSAAAEQVARAHGWRFDVAALPINTDAVALNFHYCTIYLSGLDVYQQGGDVDAVAALIEARLSLS
jgi:hypothetical protein